MKVGKIFKKLEDAMKVSKGDGIHNEVLALVVDDNGKIAWDRMYHRDHIDEDSHEFLSALTMVVDQYSMAKK